jgi:hypothetical protein
MMTRTVQSMLAVLTGGLILGACSGGDTLTSPMGTTVASVQQPAPAASHGDLVRRGSGELDMVVLHLPIVPPGFVARVSELGGTVVWTRGSTAMVAGLSDDARAELARHRAVAEVWRHRR